MTDWLEDANNAKDYQSEIISFGSDSKAMVYPKNIVLEKNHCSFDLNCPHGSETINLNLPGMHNIINANII